MTLKTKKNKINYRKNIVFKYANDNLNYTSYNVIPMKAVSDIVKKWDFIQKKYNKENQSCLILKNDLNFILKTLKINKDDLYRELHLT